jgi:hypothetical protein
MVRGEGFRGSQRGGRGFGGRVRRGGGGGFKSDRRYL